ncbi:MAG: secondary thiamine-phosphate synthase enzyme YjbQ [Desulfobacteraceae bacterium]|nr:secondary thiamine-phosphate synthase enzyme YjbQ [Desulfobacteraceae bacterium]
MNTQAYREGRALPLGVVIQIREHAMPEIQMYSETLRVSMGTGPDIANIHDLLEKMVRDRGIETGVLHVFAVGSTASLTTIEFEPGVLADLKRAIENIAPPGAVYEHERAWHDGNGHSHVQAALLGPSLGVPIRNGSLATGTWQQVVLINHDVHPRERRVEVSIIGRAR